MIKCNILHPPVVYCQYEQKKFQKGKSKTNSIDEKEFVEGVAE